MSYSNIIKKQQSFFRDLRSCVVYTIMDKEILQRYVEGNVTDKEVAIIVNWLNEDEAHVREYMALHKLYEISILNNDAFKNITLQKKYNIPYKKTVFELLKIAAVISIFYGGIKFFDRKEEKDYQINYQTVFTPAGQRAELTLPDSTKVWLNANSKLVYPVGFGGGERVVSLYGEAYFKVAHDAERPFIVKTEKMDIQVLGTEFNTIAYSGNSKFEVFLLTGSVRINAHGVQESLIMKPNEHLTLKEGKLYISHIKDPDYFKWKEGLISFNHETVEHIMEKLQLYFDIKINVERTELLKYRYTGKFKTKDGIEQVFKVLQLEHKFKYTRNDELNLITIK